MKRKLIALLLCLTALLTLSFSSCGKKDESDALEEEASARTAVTLTMWVVSEEEIGTDAEARIEEAFNELTKAKYTTAIDFVFYTEEEYFEKLDEKLTLAAENKANEAPAIFLPGMAGETTETEETEAETFVNEYGQRQLKYPDVEEHQVDIVFLAGKDLLERYASEGQLMAMDTNLNATSKVLKDYIYPSFLEQIKYEKTTYAVPNNHLIGDYTYLLVNKEMAQKYYFDTSKLLSFTDCRDLITDIAENEKDVAPVLAYADPVNMHYWLGNNDMAIIASYVPAQATLGSRTVMRSVFDTSSFTEHMLLMQRCKDNNWFAVNPETDAFGVGIVKGGYEVAAKYADQYDVKVLSYPVLEEKSVYSSMFAVTAYTADFNRSMEIITLINTNAEAKNLLQYGVEKVDYMLDDDGNFVSLTDTLDADNRYVMNNLYTGNAFLAYPTEDMPADVWENAKAANRDSRISPYYGLSVDWGNVTEGYIESLREISDEYIARMLACNSEEELAEFFIAAKLELSTNELFKGAFSTDSDSNSPYAVYSRWFERLWPSAE